MDSFEEATMSMAANAVLSRRQVGSHRKRTMGRHATVDSQSSDAINHRQWSILVDQSTQVDSRRQEVESEYMKKKTILQGLLLIVLLLHTTTNLRLLQASVSPPPFYNLIMVVTVLALVCQVAAGGLLAVIAFMERSEKHDLEVIKKINEVTIHLIFAVLLLCVFLSSLVPNYKKDSNVHIYDNSGIVIE